MTGSSVRTVGLVARRELVTRLHNKAFVISTAVMLALLVAGLVVGSVLSRNGDDTTVGVVGGAPGISAALTAAGQTAGEPVRVKAVADAASARTQVVDGSLDAALVGTPDGRYTTVSKSQLGTTLKAVLAAATQQATLDQALQAQGVDRQAVADSVSRAVPTAQTVEHSDPDRSQRMAIAYAAVFLLFFSVYLYGLYVAMGVVEEKSSRVVELLLATIRPLDLLVGKVIGIGAVGLLQVTLFGGVGLVAGVATGLVTVTSTAVALFASMLVWYVLGFAFFAVLYAAAGSLVSRQEDVNSVTAPMNVLAFATFFAAQYALSDPEGPVVSVLAWIPPFSATLVPVRIAAGVAEPLQVVVAVLAMLVATAVAAVLAARVYQRSVLNTGRKLGWKQALESA